MNKKLEAAVGVALFLTLFSGASYYGLKRDGYLSDWQGKPPPYRDPDAIVSFYRSADLNKDGVVTWGEVRAAVSGEGDMSYLHRSAWQYYWWRHAIGRADVYIKKRPEYEQLVYGLEAFMMFGVLMIEPEEREEKK